MNKRSRKFKYDWICNYCNEKNFGNMNREKCYKCGRDKYLALSQSQSQSQSQSRSQSQPEYRSDSLPRTILYDSQCMSVPVAHTSTQYNTYKNGDWKCDICKNPQWNFSSRSFCRWCGGNKTIDPLAVPQQPLAVPQQPLTVPQQPLVVPQISISQSAIPQPVVLQSSMPHPAFVYQQPFMPPQQSVPQSIVPQPTVQNERDIQLSQIDMEIDVIICGICNTNKKNISFGCGHTTCKMCSDQLDKCPFCREKINDKRRLFLD